MEPMAHKHEPTAAPYEPIAWASDHVRLLDQTLLPNEIRYLELDSVERVAEAITTMRVRIGAASTAAEARAAALDKAHSIHEEQRQADARMAASGGALLPAGGGVLTLCNTGPLATGGGGTALGVIAAAWRAGRA